MDNQHYVTKAYLDRFVHPSSLAEDNRVLYPYSKGGNPCRPRGTKRIGSAVGFYTQRLADGRLDNSLDESIQRAEKLMFASGKRTTGVLAQCVFSDQLPRSPSERLDLVAGIALMRCRTPVQIHNTSVFMDLCNNMWALNQLNTSAARDAYRKSGIPESELDNAINRDREELLSGKLWVGVDDQRQQGFESFRSIDHLVPTMARMRVRLIKAFHKDVFVTSDNPVVINVPEAPEGQGLAQSRATELWFPISHNRGLLLDHHSGTDTVVQAGHSMSIRLNRRIIKWCYRFVYSPLPLEWLNNAVRAEHFNPMLGKMRSLQDLVDSADGDLVETYSYLRSAEPFDVFEGRNLR